MEVSIDSMIKAHEDGEKISKVRDNQQIKAKTAIKTKPKITFTSKIPSAGRNNKLLDLIKRNSGSPQSNFTSNISTNDETEVKDGVKDGIFSVLSLPMREPSQRKTLKSNLESSKYMNNYIDNNFYTSYLSGVNSELKFLACYGYHYMKVYQGTQEISIVEN